jgi:hypothetical protein
MNPSEPQMGSSFLHPVGGRLQSWKRKEKYFLM